MTIGTNARPRKGRARLLALVAVAAAALVLALRFLFADRVDFCGGADACYYFALAREIATCWPCSALPLPT